MKETVTLKELIAIAVRRGRLMIVLAVICALVLGTVGIVEQVKLIDAPANLAATIQAEHEAAIESYEQQKAQLQEDLEKYQRYMKKEQDYHEKSTYLKIDPYNKAYVQIDLAITDFDENTFQQVFEVEGTPVDFIVSRIQNQFLIRWRNVDLQKELNSELPDMYLREVVHLNAQSGGLLEITAIGNTVEEAEKLAKAAYRFVQESQNVVSKSAYPHDFALLNESAKVLVDMNMESEQKAAKDRLASYADTVESTQQKLDNLKAPTPREQITVKTAMVEGAKNVILGCALGVFLGVLWAIISYLFSNKLAFSFQLEQLLAAPMMASVPGKKNIWNKLADKMTGERVWKTQEEAVCYLKESASLRLTQGQRILLLSTLNCKEDSKTVQLIKDELATTSGAVEYVSDASRNARTLRALANSDYVIFLERCSASKLCQINTVITLAQEQGKPIKGFIMI